MQASNYLKLFFISSIILLVGCSSEEQTVEQNTNIELNKSKMYGAWQSADKLYGFEFHASPTKVGTILTEFTLLNAHLQPEGVIYENGKAAYYFTWSLLANGLLRLDVKTSACQSRPLILCSTDFIQMVEVIGSNEQSLIFKVSEDIDLDGQTDKSFDWLLNKKQLVNFSVGEKSYLIEKKNHAASQYSASESDGTLSVYLPMANGDHQFVESKRDLYSIELKQASTIRTTETFYVYNHGEKDIGIIHDYEYLRIYPSFDDSLIVSTKVKRKFDIQGDFNVSNIDLDGYLLNQKLSRNFRIVNAGNFIPNIEYGKRYFGNFFEVFDIEGLDNGIANQVVFLDNNKAVITTGDVLSDIPFVEKIFDWRKGSHEGEFIFESDEVISTIEFLSGENERYRVVLSTYNKLDEEFLVKNTSDFFFAVNEYIDLTTLFPLEFEFVHNNGVTISPVRLLEDGEVELVNIDQVAGGRWFFNGNNELIRFECVTVAEVEILDYQECLDSFQYVATSDTKTDYSHISRLRFINKIGNNYLVQYDAAFWGGRWGREDHIRRFSTYYQWVHFAR